MLGSSDQTRDDVRKNMLSVQRASQPGPRPNGGLSGLVKVYLWKKKVAGIYCLWCFTPSTASFTLANVRRRTCAFSLWSCLPWAGEGTMRVCVCVQTLRRLKCCFSVAFQTLLSCRTGIRMSATQIQIHLPLFSSRWKWFEFKKIPQNNCQGINKFSDMDNESWRAFVFLFDEAAQWSSEPALTIHNGM